MIRVINLTLELTSILNQDPIELLNLKSINIRAKLFHQSGFRDKELPQERVFVVHLPVLIG